MQFHVWARTRSHSVAMAERKSLADQHDFTFEITDVTDPDLPVREKYAAQIVHARFLVGVRSEDGSGAKP